MATFYVNGSVNKLFNGDYHGQVKCTATRNESNNTYKISVTGIRAYCKFGWNFRSDWEVSLSGDSKSASDSGSIGSSGDNSYKGWLPSSGFNSVTASITVNGTSEGKCPKVTLKFKIGNKSITWLSQGETVITSSTYSGNIKDTVLAETNGPNDVSSPTISTFTAVPKTSTKTLCTIKANAASQYQIKKGSASVGSGSLSANTQITKEVSATAGSNRYTITVTKNNNGKSATKSATSDNTIPTITIEDTSPASLDSADISVSCNYPYKWRVGSGSWSSKISANTSSSKSLKLTNAQHTVSVQASRTDVASGGKIKSSAVDATIDMRLPSIYSYSIKPTSNTKGTLSFRTGYKTTWSLIDSRANVLNVGENDAETITQEVVLNNNCTDAYTLKVVRKGKYSPLYNEISQSVSTILPTLTITEAVAEGNTIKFSANTTHNGGEISCNNWRYELSGNITGTVSGTISNESASSASSVEKVITNVPVGEEFKLRVYATYPDSGLECSAEHEGLTCTGATQLWHGDKWINSFVFIYVEEQWKGAVPYVYDGSTWKQALNK